ncbi:FAD-binding protein [Solimonas terrae]|uniref:3-oxosteroid 1-dehydrogenase n=1 Tax=Solimonas terrae TaxID=1396819 RepID=A0A6M2BRZ6_9GAMM|nr:FAD-binding protein [Solimonas terrae]NGY04873.1 FAD-binding protein [Solimonas terrae]
MGEPGPDHEVDVLVVGSGAGAMTAALRAAHAGASVLIVEKAAVYGGTSATSGGGLWIPGNHLMADCGIEDSDADAMQYMAQLVGEDAPAANVRAFVTQGKRMLRWLTEHSHVAYQAMSYYADYYQHLPGAKTGARSIDPLPYHAGVLGRDFHDMQAPHIQTRVLGMIGYSNSEGAILLSKSPGWFKLLCKLTIGYFLDLPWRLRSRRSRRLTMGNALIGRLRRSLLDRRVSIWLRAPVKRLITDAAGAVVGVEIERDGARRTIRATRGVILGSGGFEHNQALRTRYLPQPTQTHWSAASPGNTGDLLIEGQRLGAATRLLDEAWWGPTMHVRGEDRARMLFTERSMPGAIVVNKKGARFFNESVAYTTAVQAMYAAGNLPAYLIFDARYAREYPFGPLLPGGMHLNWLQLRHIRRELLTTAPSLAALATRLGIDADGLAAGVARFNGFAVSGKDEDFQRGENPYDLLYGDARVQPNPCLAPLAEAPFHALEIHPGDIGTKGGLATNEHAQVLHVNGRPIAGLYAVGNVAASVTGRYYPGAGATLGPAMTFGFLAAEHACRDLLENGGAETDRIPQRN